MATKSPTRLKVLNPPVRRTGVAIAAPQATGDVPQTPYLNLNLPPTGFPSWGPDLNQNFSAIDAAVGSLQRAYQGDWINNRVYAAGQIVIFEGGVFISLVSGNIGLQPDLHPEAWGPMGSATSITYPPAGIAVSQGSAGWAPSMDPTDLPRLSAPINNFRGLIETTVNVSGSSQGNITAPVGGVVVGWNMRYGYGETFFVNAKSLGGGGFLWYNVASGALIDGTTQPVMSIDSNGSLVLTAPVICTQTATGILYDSIFQAPNITAGQRLIRLSGISNNTGMIFASGFHNGGSAAANFAFFNLGGTSGETRMDTAGNWTIPGWVTAGSGLSSGRAHDTYMAGSVYNGLLFNALDDSLTTRLVANGDAGTRGQITLTGNSPGGSGAAHYLIARDSGVSVRGPLYLMNNAGTSVANMDTNGQVNCGSVWANSTITAITANISGGVTAGLVTGTQLVVPSTTNNMRLWQDGGSTFIDGGAGSRLLLNGGVSGGVVQVNGQFLVVNGSKDFKIIHPLDDDKWLVHSCIEGPEISVFYRGEAETKDGVAEITLPDYFEALTFPDDRTVLLTELYEDEDNPVFGNFLAVGRIRDGKFKVRSSIEAVKFFWEVKAVRRAGGVDRLEVVRDIEEADRNVPANKAMFEGRSHAKSRTN
jgi:hypothetical protein